MFRLISLFLLYIVILAFELPINWWAIILTYLLSLLFWNRLAPILTSRARDTHAVPKIRGRLPGNIDILWQLIYDESHEYCGETLRKWAEIYGPTYDLNILFGHQIVTADPANVKHILAIEFDSFAKGKKFYAMFETFLGRGIFTTDGDTWKYHRTMARPFLTTERMSDFDCFERHFSKTTAVMLEHARRGEAFDAQHLFARFTLDAGTDFLFGHSVNSLGQDTKHVSGHDYHAFAEAFNTMSAIATRRVRIGSLWPLFELGRNPTKKPMKIINEFVEPIIKSSMARDAHTHIEERTFLDHLVKSSRDIKLARDELLNILLAARDTTASLLTFVTYALALHPEVMQILRDEIEYSIGENALPTLTDIRRMKYLRAVLNEVLRLFPPVPFNIRRCVKPSILPSPLSKSGPFNVSPGVSITYSPLLIQRRADVWGDSACVFEPKRWLRDGSKTHVTDPFAFLPFNGGPRMCLGQQFAYHECSYFIIRMLQTFKELGLASDAQLNHSRPPVAWSTSTIERQGIEKCWPGASLTLYSKGGLWVRVKA